MLGIFKDKSFSLASAWAFNQLAYAIVYPFIPLYLHNERGIPQTTVSLIFPLMGLAIMTAPPVFGWMTDKIGRGFTMDFGQVVRGLAFLVMALMTLFAAPFWTFAVIMMVNAAVGIAFQVGADTYLADLIPLEKRGGYYGKIRIGLNIGWALGPMLGAFFSKTPFWLFFFLTALLCFLGALFTHYVCGAPTWISKEQKAASAVREKQQKNQERMLFILLKNRRLLCLLAGNLLLCCLTSQLYSTFSVYATNRIGLTKEILGLVYSWNGFMILLMQLPVNVLLEKKLKVSWKAQLALGAASYALGYFILGPASGVILAVLGVTILTLGEIIIQPSLYASVSGETTPENAGRIFSAMSLVRGVGFSVGPWFGAQLYQHLSSSVLLWTLLSMFAVGAGIAFSLPVSSKSLDRMLGGVRMLSRKLTGR